MVLYLDGVAYSESPSQDSHSGRGAMGLGTELLGSDGNASDLYTRKGQFEL
jgi:hypothetical protein